MGAAVAPPAHEETEASNRKQRAKAMSVGVRRKLRRVTGLLDIWGVKYQIWILGSDQSLENRLKQTDKPLRDQLGGQAGAQTTGSE